jgi:hypothetical protein
VGIAAEVFGFDGRGGKASTFEAASAAVLVRRPAATAPVVFRKLRRSDEGRFGFIVWSFEDLLEVSSYHGGFQTELAGEEES